MLYIIIFALLILLLYFSFPRETTFLLDWLDWKGTAEWGKAFEASPLTPTQYNLQSYDEAKFNQSGFTMWSGHTLLLSLVRSSLRAEFNKANSADG